MYNRPSTTKPGKQKAEGLPVSSNARRKVCSCAVAVKSTAVVLQPSQGVSPVEPGGKLLGVTLNGQVTVLQKKRKDFSFRCQSNKKPIVTLSCKLLGIALNGQVTILQKNRKDFSFRRQLSEKPIITPLQTPWDRAEWPSHNSAKEKK